MIFEAGEEKAQEDLFDVCKYLMRGAKKMEPHFAQ